jgi:hypothetical protein
MKVNSIATIKTLHLKPSLLSHMPVSLCRVVVVPIVIPTRSLDLALLKSDFVHGYQEGAAVFYLSTTNDGGQINKVTDENLKSWDPL